MHLPSLDMMLESFRDPPRRHAMMVHFPIVLSVLGLVATLALVAVRGRVGWLRWVTVGLFLTGAAMGYFAAQAGEAADDHLTEAGVDLTDAANDKFNEHGAMGEKVWMYMTIAGVAVALTAIRWGPIRAIFLVLSLGAALVAVGWVAVTAHYGGELVYVHGVGVPQSANNYPMSQPAPPARTQPAEVGASLRDSR